MTRVSRGWWLWAAVVLAASLAWIHFAGSFDPGYPKDLTAVRQLPHKFPLRPELIELLLGLLTGLVLFLRRSWLRPRFESATRAIRATARQRFRWILTAAFLGPCIRLLLLPWAPMPSPIVHDEFVHTLAADTLLHGRLANPPHAFQEAFETIYVIQEPTYSASYPLGNALFLAAGKKVTGVYWAGVWLAMVLCCGALAWMQHQWLPPAAAWLGSVLCSVTMGVSSQWMNTYYGGAAAAAGGALVFGALRPLLRHARYRDAGILAIGWALLWFSRPYESVIVGLIVGGAILWAIHKPRPSAARLRAAAILIAGTVLLDAAATGYHNWRVTGDPAQMPYQLTQVRYGVPHAFLWQKEIPQPPGLTAQQQRMYAWQQGHYRAARSLSYRWSLLWDNLKKIWALYIGYPLTIPFALALVSKSPKMRSLRWSAGMCLAWSMLYPRILPNYLAAATGLFFALSAYGMLALSRWRRGVDMAGACLAAALCIGTLLTTPRILHAWYFFGHPETPPARTLVAQRLQKEPGKQLVFVRYGSEHNLHDEWVYNEADIDSAQVVWVNDLGEEKNRAVMQYFAGRTAWLAAPDSGVILGAYAKARTP